MTEDKKNNNGGWWGVVLIAVGALLLLHNFNLIVWDWYALWRAWPAFLIVWGLGMLNIDERMKRLLILIIAAVVLIWVMGGFGSSARVSQDRMMMRMPSWDFYWR